MAGSVTSGIWRLAPLAAIGGAALAVGAWTLPIPGLTVTPKDVTAAPIGAGPAPRSPAEYLPPIPGHDWTTLVEPLNEARPDVPRVTDVEEVDEVEPPPDTTPSMFAGWRLAGIVTEPDGLVAIVSINEQQRYLRVGQRVTLGDGRTEGEVLRVEREPDRVVIGFGDEGEEQAITADGAQSRSSQNRRPAPGSTRGRNRPSGRS